MVQLDIVNPVALPEPAMPSADRFPLAPRPTTLSNLTVGLYWNGKNHGDLALERTKEALSKLFENVRFVDYLGEKGGLTRYATEQQLERIKRECDVIVGTTGDCGSCTSWLIRDMSAMERLGLPTVAWVSTGFMKDARWSSEVFGCVDLALAEVPYPFTNRDPVSIAQMVDDGTPAIVAALTSQNADDVDRFASAIEELDLPSETELSFTGDDLLECFDEMNRQFIKGGFSDGMPLVPPTRAKVDAMVAASGRSADEVVGIFAPGFGIGTVEKIAANAVMAGAQPNAMPVILAMVDCMLDPIIGLRTWAMSTGPQAPVVMVSGPIAKEIGMNSGVCALGPGSISSVNVAIGRTMRLIMMNVGHSYPGISDMDTIGSSMKFSACVAENEERNPWESCRVTQGFTSQESTVTLNVPYGVCELFDFENHDPESLIESYATVTRNIVGSPTPGVWLIKTFSDPQAGYPFNGLVHNLIMMCPEHAEAFAAAGWSIQDIKDALYKRSRLPFKEAMINKPMALFKASHPELQFLIDQPDAMVSLYSSPESFQIFVVGAVAGRSLYFHGGTCSVTKPVR
jgi:hypothetical protein